MAVAIPAKDEDIAPKLGDQLVFDEFAPASNDNILHDQPLESGDVASGVYFTVGYYTDHSVAAELIAALDASESNTSDDAATFSPCVVFVAGEVGSDA
ncbi:MAG: hypothetical protein CTY20_08410 [Hyphomicrobium sp.]|nr:MAG: hypothetical protein CTY20_08410 [Hyphomicrobium sp.]